MIFRQLFDSVSSSYTCTAITDAGLAHLRNLSNLETTTWPAVESPMGNAATEVTRDGKA